MRDGVEVLTKYGDHAFIVDSTTCALCQNYDCWESDVTCPLGDCDSDDSPYSRVVGGDAPVSVMINALKKAMKQKKERMIKSTRTTRRKHDKLLGMRIIKDDVANGKKCSWLGVKTTEMTKMQLIGFIGMLDDLATARYRTLQNLVIGRRIK